MTCSVVRAGHLSSRSAAGVRWTWQGRGRAGRARGTVLDYEGVGKVPGPGVPVVAIPTTAGTGSEVTIFSVITDHKRKFKLAVGSPFTVPQVAICDPELTLSMPPALTAATGMDALTHAIECYVNTVHNPISKTLALEAIRLIGRALRRAFAMAGTWLRGPRCSWRRPWPQWRSPDTAGKRPRHVASAGGTSMSAWGGERDPLAACHGLEHGGLLRHISRRRRALGERVAGLAPHEAAQAAVDAVRRLSRDVAIPNGCGIKA